MGFAAGVVDKRLTLFFNVDRQAPVAVLPVLAVSNAAMFALAAKSV